MFTTYCLIGNEYLSYLIHILVSCIITTNSENTNNQSQTIKTKLQYKLQILNRSRREQESHIQLKHFHNPKSSDPLQGNHQGHDSSDTDRCNTVHGSTGRRGALE